MKSASVVILLGVVVLVAGALWWLWRRRQLALVGGEQPEYWKDERTLCATYEDLGIARAARQEDARGEDEDATACLNMDEVAATESRSQELDAKATEFLDMREIMDPGGVDPQPQAGPERGRP